uniref:Large ribosomal subunit protein eL28 n=1 Tax=Spadella cephaloptera TaxID=52888 RepID=A8E687_9BILA|nr:TPA: putative 60S ribosomal protein L28 [Spadella cephaloptera]
MSTDLCWMVVRNTSSFMVKGRLSRTKVFTKEPNNLTGLHSLKSSGLGAKAVGIVPAPDNKGVVLVTKKTKVGNKPAKSLNRVTLRKGRRAVLTSVANSVRSYDKSKKSTAMKRTSAILRSQRPRIGKKTKKD